jgi:hypothetical protein
VRSVVECNAFPIADGPCARISGYSKPQRGVLAALWLRHLGTGCFNVNVNELLIPRVQFYPAGREFVLSRDIVHVCLPSCFIFPSVSVGVFWGCGLAPVLWIRWG